MLTCGRSHDIISSINKMEDNINMDDGDCTDGNRRGFFFVNVSAELVLLKTRLKKFRYRRNTFLQIKRLLT